MNQGTARVFITGLGIISPAGAGAGPFWDDVCAGRSRFEELPPLYAGMKPGILGGRVPREARDTASPRSGKSPGNARATPPSSRSSPRWRHCGTPD